jgi:amino acid permease
MSLDGFESLTKEAILGGSLDARRATTILFALESRTSYLKQQSYLVASRVVTAETAEAKEQEFLGSLAKGRDFSDQLSIQDLERYAMKWTDLIPDNPNLLAAVAHLLGQKYEFSYQSVPRMRAVLRIDEMSVKEAYQKQYQVDLETIYQPSLGFGTRLRWSWTKIAAWLEDLPPFWAAFSLTLTETVGASILALPIALAEVGPLAGVALLIVLGIVNILTISALVEAINRNGHMRYGTSYFGRLVGEFLGGTGSLIFTIALFSLNIFALMAFYVGVASTLGDATKVPESFWVLVIFLVGAFFLRRKSLDATIASALLIGIINIGLILLLSVITISHVTSKNLMQINLPFINGGGFDPGILELVFGVILSAYFGHTSAANASKVVLQRDPSGRSLLWGNVAAIALAIVIFCIWILVVNGSIPADILANTSGTALTPLAIKVGPVVLIFGSLYVVLSMGMGTIHMSLGIYNQIRERLGVSSLKKAALNSMSDRTKVRNALLRSEVGQFTIALIPIFFVFLIVQWMFWTGQESFAGIIGFIGVVIIPLLAGIFPMLMLVASRRKGDYVPGLIWRFLGNRGIVLVVYLIFLISILLYGLVIWEDPLQRAIALLVAVGTVVVSIVFIWQGVYNRRYVFELKNVFRHASITLTESGKAASAESKLGYSQGDEIEFEGQGEIPRYSGLISVISELRKINAQELKVWAHQITPEGISLPLPGKLSIKDEKVSETYNLEEEGGEVIKGLDDLNIQLRIDLED